MLNQEACTIFFRFDKEKNELTKRDADTGDQQPLPHVEVLGATIQYSEQLYTVGLGAPYILNVKINRTDLSFSVEDVLEINGSSTSARGSCKLIESPPENQF